MCSGIYRILTEKNLTFGYSKIEGKYEITTENEINNSNLLDAENVYLLNSHKRPKGVRYDCLDKCTQTCALCISVKKIGGY